jgi:hypothetical protein
MMLQVKRTLCRWKLERGPGFECTSCGKKVDTVVVHFMCSEDSPIGPRGLDDAWVCGDCMRAASASISAFELEGT